MAYRFTGLTAAALAVLSVPAAAKVTHQDAAGFAVAHTAQVAASPEAVWDMLRTPSKWWSKAHSWSGDAANFWIDVQPGGCFCEKLPAGKDQIAGVRHGEVLFAKPGALLRITGAFGPLQGEGLNANLTIALKPQGTGTAIRFDYVVGGFARFPLKDVAPAVDGVIAEQLKGLADALGGPLPVGGEAAEKPAPEGKPTADRPALDIELPDTKAEADTPRS